MRQPRLFLGGEGVCRLEKRNADGGFGIKPPFPSIFPLYLDVIFLTVPVGSVVSAVPVILPGLPMWRKVHVANTLGNAEEDLSRDGKAA